MHRELMQCTNISTSDPSDRSPDSEHEKGCCRCLSLKYVSVLSDISSSWTLELQVVFNQYIPARNVLDSLSRLKLLGQIPTDQTRCPDWQYPWLSQPIHTPAAVFATACKFRKDVEISMVRRGESSLPKRTHCSWIADLAQEPKKIADLNHVNSLIARSRISQQSLLHNMIIFQITCDTQENRICNSILHNAFCNENIATIPFTIWRCRVVESSRIHPRINVDCFPSNVQTMSTRWLASRIVLFRRAFGGC